MNAALHACCRLSPTLAWLAALVLFLPLLLPGNAGAAVTCAAVAPPAYVRSYPAGSAPSTSALQMPVTITCSRGSTSDWREVVGEVFADNGINASGAVNRAVWGGEFIQYEYFRDFCQGSEWTNNTSSIAPASQPLFSWAANATGSQTRTLYVWACVTSTQYPAAGGPYLDSLTTRFSWYPQNSAADRGGLVDAWSSAAAVAITVAGSCAFTRIPDPISVNYTAFGAAASGSTSFGFTCSNGTPYTMDVSPANGTLLGVDYALTLSTAAATGTGAQQNHTVTATAARRQAGQCAAGTCSANQIHTLTISY